MTHPQGNFKAEKATLYYQGTFGSITKLEVREVQVTRRRFAQYPSAVICSFLAPRKRKWQSYTASYQPYLVVLEGWGHFEPGSPWKNTTVGDGVITQEGRYSCCDERWGTDFDAELAAYLEANPQAKVLGDYRHTTGCNTYDAKPAEEYLVYQTESLTRQLAEAGVSTEHALKAAETFVRSSPQLAAAYLSNIDDDPFICGVEFKRGKYALEYKGQLIAPEAF